MHGNLGHCDRCQQLFDYEELDAKPMRFDRWWWFLLPWKWANSILGRAADTGEQFDGLYCRRCYGPAFCEM